MVLFVGMTAFFSPPPCDKPTSCPWLPDPQTIKHDAEIETPNATINWSTVEGASVSYLSKPSPYKVWIQLLYEPKSLKDTQVKQSMVIEISNAGNGLPDAQTIEQSMPAPMPNHTLAKVDITINDIMAEQQAKKVAAVISKIIYHLHKPDNNALQDK